MPQSNSPVSERKKKRRAIAGGGGRSNKTAKGKVPEKNIPLNGQLFYFCAENIKEGAGLCDEDGVIKYVNTGLCNTLGYTREELIGQLLTNFLPKPGKTKYEKLNNKYNSAESFKIKQRWLSKCGNRVLTEIFIKALYENNKFKGTFFVITGLTEHNELPESLHDNELPYRQIVARAHDGIGIIQDFVFKYVNDNLANILGYTDEKLIGIPFLELINEGDRDKFIKLYQKGIRQKNKSPFYESLIKSIGDKEQLIEIYASVIQYEGNYADLVFVHDMTYRKKIYKALIESERKFRNLQNNIPLGLYRSNPAGRFISANLATIRLFGYKNWEELEKVNIVDIYLHKKDRNGFLDLLNKYHTVEDFEVELLRKDGTAFWASISTTAVYNENKKPVYYDGIIHDISEKKFAEAALKESEEKFRLISEQSLLAIVIFQNGVVKYFNEAFCKLTEYNQNEIRNWKPNDYLKTIYPDDLRILIKKGRELLTRPRIIANRFTFRGISKNGTIKYVDNYTKRIRFEGKPALLMSLIDISEQKLMEDEIQKTQKLESTGLLAGGIAHDFNNRLSVILGNAQLARMNIDSNFKLDTYLHNIESSAAQATSLTQQLLTFSKGGKPIKSLCSIQEIIREAVNLSLSGSNITCREHFGERLWNVSVDKGQITQVINNLLINAEQAMPEGGCVDIFAENYFYKKNDSANFLEKGIYIKITIQDYGTGIPLEIVSKIFDPYFSTKQKGSGLGLSVAYSIIENHKGYINVESEFGTGSKFIIYLPATREGLKGKVRMNENYMSGYGKILVMDDEEYVLDMVCDLLQSTGFNTLKAKDGHEAIQYYSEAQQIKEPFHAVIMDLTIPGGMGGKETIKELKKIDPNVKAIVSSGYSNDPIMSNFKDYGFSGVIAKPYKINKLHEVLNQVISEI
ncbi:PAS domain S-box protein [candidate division KSB1 bacterium]|nr:PAS domain S-box protein [candidate division KSB1 bacterium]